MPTLQPVTQARDGSEIVLSHTLDFTTGESPPFVMPIPVRAQVKILYWTGAGPETETWTLTTPAGTIGSVSVAMSGFGNAATPVESLASFDRSANFIEAGESLIITPTGAIGVDWTVTAVFTRGA
jgi:hypothetical protein